MTATTRQEGIRRSALVILEPETCCTCGVAFGMPTDLLAARRRDGGWFYCPNGHQQHFTKTEAELLREQLDREKRWRRDAETRATAARDQAQAAERSARAYRGVATRVRNRAARGRCPVVPCGQEFADLAAHMAAVHPEYPASEEHPPGDPHA